MNHRNTMILAAAAALLVLVLGSCELALGPRTEGTIILNLGGGPSSRAFSDAPFDGLPVFSSVTVTVSGSGMPTASQTVPGTAASVTLQVPAGPARKVEVYAVPDWAATAALILDPLPTLAKAYGGTVIVDVAGGQKVGVSMDMGVVETKIVLPDPLNGNSIKVAESIETIGVLTPFSIGLGSEGRAGFDRYGRILYSDTTNSWLLSRTNPGEVSETAGFGNGPFAFDPGRNRLYYYDGSLRFRDFTTLEYIDITIPGSWSPDGQGMAVDEDGYLYTVFMQSEDRYLVKLRITEPVWDVEVWISDAIVVASARYDTIGLGTNLNIGDMAVADDKLFVVAYEINAYYSMLPEDAISRGKIVAIERSTLSRLMDYGWTSDPIPPSDTTSMLFGPRRIIAIVPKKLVVADDGFWWNGAHFSEALEDRNGVAVLNTETGELTRTEVAGIQFIESFSTIFVC